MASFGSPAMVGKQGQLKDGEEETFLLAIPKKGRLYTKCLKLLEGAGIDFVRPNRLDIAKSSSLPITLVFLPAKDIALYVAAGNVDMGITGVDIVQEADVEDMVIEELKLGFGKCRLCLQAPVADAFSGPEELVGKRIVTTFTSMARSYFDKFPGGEKTQISFLSGSVEAACALGLADAIVDLVETGTTMRAAGLDVVDTIMHTESILISNKRSSQKDMVKKITTRFRGFLTAMKYDMLMYDIRAEKLDEAKSLTPGLVSPTVMQLPESNGEQWFAVQSMVLKKETASIMDTLQSLGARGILIMEVKNCRV